MNEVPILVPLTAIRVDHNARQTFDEEALDSLAASIERDGLLQPIVVRPCGESEFELVAGERRLRAHQRLDRDTIMATVLTLDDEAAKRAQLTENLEREDLTPLEEGAAFKQLLDMGAYTAEQLADQVGRSEGYVWQRVRLLDVDDAVKAVLDDGTITVGHALVMARLTPEFQQKCVEWVQNTWGPKDIRTLETYIQQRLMMELEHAPFDTDDLELYPEAGSCLNCPKRTGAMPGLWPEIEEDDRCTDPSCFEEKVTRFVAAAKEQGWTPVSSSYEGGRDGAVPSSMYEVVEDGSCENATPAIVVDGFRMGQELTVCIGECEVHKTHREATKADDGQRQRRREKKERKRRQFEVATIGYEKVLERLTWPPDAEQLAVLVRTMWADLNNDSQRTVAYVLNLEGETSEHSGNQKTYTPALTRLVEAFEGDDADPVPLYNLLVLLVAAPMFTRARMNEGWEQYTPLDRVREFTQAFGYQLHNAERTVVANAKVELPEDG